MVEVVRVADAIRGDAAGGRVSFPRSPRSSPEPTSAGGTSSTSSSSRSSSTSCCTSCGHARRPDRPRRRRARGALLGVGPLNFRRQLAPAHLPAHPRLRHHRRLPGGDPKGLAHLGRAPFLGGAARRRQEEVVDEIVLAATTLASSAPAPSSLEREMACGATWRRDRPRRGADLRLLLSIFHPADASPRRGGGHPGEPGGGGGVLPALTVNPELSRTLGSRHRAAIGLTRTRTRWPSSSRGVGGDIGGRGRPHPAGLDGPALKQALLASLGLSPAAPPPRRRRPCGARAGRDVPARRRGAAPREPRPRRGLWFMIAGRQTAERGVSVPVELRNVPGISSSPGKRSTRSTSACGLPGLINSLERAPCAPPSTSSGRGGRADRAALPGPIQAPQGFRVVKITPSLLTLNLERTLRKTVPVRPRLIGRPAPASRLPRSRATPRRCGWRPAEPDPGDRERLHRARLRGGTDTTATELVNVGLEDPLLRIEGAAACG